MTTRDKPGHDSINHAFTSAVSQPTQYRESFFNYFNTYLSAGWTVEFTCNGVTANTSNNLPNAAAVTIGLNGSQPISYFVVRSPTNWVTRGPIRILVATNESNASATPQAIIFRISIGPYALVGTPTQNIPTTTSPEIVPGSARQIIPWAGATAGYWSSWWTDDGDVQFGVKMSGASNPFNVFISITAPGPLDNGAVGELACALFHVQNALGNCLPDSTGVTGFSFRRDGVALSGIQTWSPAGVLVNWILGQDDGLSVGFFFIEAFTLGSSDPNELRYLGYIPNVRGCPITALFNDYDTADPDPVVYAILGGWAVPTTVASWATPSQPFA